MSGTGRTRVVVPGPTARPVAPKTPQAAAPRTRVPEARQGVGTVKVTVVAKGPGVDKQEAQDNPLHVQTREFRVESPQTSANGQWGVAKRLMKIGLSQKFQSVTVEAGLDLPWWIRAGSFEDMRSDAIEGFAAVKEIVEGQFSQEMDQIDEIMALVVERSGR